MALQNEVLGIDIGGVVIARVSDTTSIRLFKEESYLDQVAAVGGAFDAIGRLVRERFKNRVYLVSKCGPHTEKRTAQWLEHNRFFGRTGVVRSNVRYCRHRQDKAPICQALGVTHFIDDKLEVLSYLHSVKYRFLFNPREEELHVYSKIPAYARRVETWSEVLEELLP